MVKLNSFLFSMLFFFTTFVFSQNYRDKLIHETINPLLVKSVLVEKTDYEKLKEAVLTLESDYGYESDLKLKLIAFSFYHKDFEFFKEQLSILVEKYGFNVAYMKGDEVYHDELLKGGLSAWFKQMYIKNHGVWLENNFDKQIDQRKLNEIQVKTRFANSIASHLQDAKALDTVVKEEIELKLGEFHFSNVSELYSICRKYDLYPSGKNFALIQNYYEVGLLQNYERKANIERTWLLFEPYFKKSYLKNDIDYGHFKSYDFFNFAHFGYQKYGLISYDDVPRYLRAKNPDLKTVPVENAFFVEKNKREMGWR